MIGHVLVDQANCAGLPAARFLAANNVGADWNAEAVEAAQNYLDISPMSKDALIEQLSSAAGEKFTPAQARYAANKVY